jgi:prepilin-type N-terminal cleavage/methylation domain-containing protein
MRRLGTYRQSRRQAGDTIVEVLIAIAVVSLVLTSAYMVTNKNAQTMQAVQERTQAQKLVERQIELIRAADSVPTTTFCFTDDQGSDTATPAPTSSNDPCAFNGSGATSSDTSSSLYHI